MSIPRSARFFSFIPLLILPASAAQAQQRFEFSEVHMGMPVRIIAYALDSESARAATRAAFHRVASLDDALSDYRPDSELRRLEKRPGEWAPVSNDLFAVLACALRVARASEGAFDPTIGPLSVLWGQARKAGRLPPDSALALARSRVGYQHIGLDSTHSAVRLAQPGMRLDLGGIAKGYIIQQALITLRKNGVRQALVEAGGDIVAGDPPPGQPGWSVNIPDAKAVPTARAQRLANAALSTSGPAAQFIESDGVRYSHVVDARSGFGLSNGLTAHVIAGDAALADALSTALTVLGPARAGQLLAHFPGVAGAVH
jgi:thiamine biosynthesis lipoprotein